MTDTVLPPAFVYVQTPDDTLAVEIDGYADRDALLAMKGDRTKLYAWLAANMDPEDLPPLQDVEALMVEIEDIPAVALAEGNETFDVWSAA